MDVVPVGPGFGAELRGATLADVANDDAAYAAVRAAFEEHSVLVFRNQEVTDDIQLAFSRRFGPPEVTKVGSQGTGSHFVILSPSGPMERWCHRIIACSCAAGRTSSGTRILPSSGCRR